MLSFLVAFVALIGFGASEIYFQDTFDTQKWVESKWKKDSGEGVEFEYSGGLWPANENRGGLRTATDAKFYAATAKLDKDFDNDGKTLVFQFSVKHEQKMDCGGGYAKLLPPGTDVENFNGDNEYTIMFGPDICGYSTKKVQAILRDFAGEENLLKTDDVKTEDDEFTHVFTFILNADDTYEIRVDGESRASGNIKDDWKFEKPKEINDPNASKPSDWVDEEFIDDPNDEKPSDWDDEPEMISDPDAVKPEDWDDDEDGEWEAPMVPNPDFKGEWHPTRIENPEYKGRWEHPMVANPEWVEVTDVYKRGPIGYVGIEVWQVKSGTVFSDFILTDSVDEADSFAEANKVTREAEESAKEAFEAKDSENESDAEDEPEHSEL